MAENKSIFDGFANKYSLQKTIRFGLIPDPESKKWIEENHVIEKDEKLAEEYKKAKAIVDRVHKAFIENILEKLKLNEKALIAFEKETAKTKKERDKKTIEKIQASLRNEVAGSFNKDTEEFKAMFLEKIVKDKASNFCKTPEEKATMKLFDKFTTYFTGFHENRKNIYSKEAKATAIAFRIVHENLVTFVDNLRIFAKIREGGLDLVEAESELKSILGKEKLEKIFSIEYFNKVLSQGGIDFYNRIIGGEFEEGSRKKIKGLNELINLHNQKENGKLPRFKQLKKQILSDRKKALDFGFSDDSELLMAIEEFYLRELSDEKGKRAPESLKALFERSRDFDPEKIHLRNDSTLRELSNTLFGDWSAIENALSAYYERENPPKATKKYEKDKGDWLKQDQFPIATIETALSLYDYEDVKKKADKGLFFGHFSSFKKEKADKENLLERLEISYKNAKPILENKSPGKGLASDEQAKEKLKALLDALIDILHFAKPFRLKDAAISDKDYSFYGEFDPLFERLDGIVGLYNKTRNYLTKKPYSTEKIKLNFENSVLLGGWDMNIERVKGGVLFRKDGQFYLGIINQENKKVLENPPKAKEGEVAFEKMLYKVISNPARDLPHTILSKKRIAKYKPAKALLENYEQKKHIKGDNFDKKFCHELIDFFKESIKKNPDWETFNFKFSETDSYEDISGFYREVERQSYKVVFERIPASYIKTLVREGKLYLFKIWSKDFSEYSKGTPNMHTLYWRALFDEKNLKEPLYKLNGEAEMFFRKRSIEPKTTHPARTPIQNKNPDNPKKESVFEYDLIKDRRYSLDKFQFHVPITTNFGSEGEEWIDYDVRDAIKKNPVRIIGIDRGERHLLYISMIDEIGKILLQESLNKITSQYSGGKKTTDYHSLLAKSEAGRDEARRDWKKIENIKEIKEGYLSQAVHKIATLIVENEAIVVMENLNSGFKRGRIKVEKQVYQKFERMLIEKLNYLVFKKRNAEEAGGLRNALQLTSKFKSFDKLGNQSGFLFYIPAAMTSKIDPITGFANELNPKYESINKSKEFFSKFKRISYNNTKGWFEFSFDYSDFKTKDGLEGCWVVCSTPHERFYRKGGAKGETLPMNANEELKKLFGEVGIEYSNGDCLKEKIASKDSKELFKRLTWILASLISLRQNNGKRGPDEKDYILSPVEPFFCSLDGKEGLPKDADANGAYNIARKGLWAVRQIRSAEDLKKVKLAISNKEWLEFAKTMT